MNAESAGGDMAMEGGAPTVRRSFEAEEDDPDTTNDESNDQPLGHFGTVTLAVYNYQSGSYYTLDGDVNDGALERLYFPKGGWVDFWDCELDGDLSGTCWDEEGRDWEIEGEAYAGTSWVDADDLNEEEPLEEEWSGLHEDEDRYLEDEVLAEEEW